MSQGTMSKQELDGNRIFVIHHFFSKEECADLMAQSEMLGFGAAPLSTADGPVMDSSIRNNSRLIHDDPALAVRLWERGQPFLPQTLGDWQAVGFNERFRFYRYDCAERFAPHFDGCFLRQNGECSLLTFLVYLNGSCEGGETRFYHRHGLPRFAIKPEPGKALVFAHRQLHEGAAVVSGRKYVLRTDVMYRRMKADNSLSDEHDGEGW